MKASKKDFLINFLLNNKAIIILALLFIFFSSLTPKTFLTVTNLLNVTRQVSMMGILAIGYSIVIALASIDISAGNILSLTGMVISIICVNFGVPYWVAIIIGICVGALCGLINIAVSISLKINTFIITLALAQVYRGLALIISEGKPVIGLPDTAIFLGQGYIGFVPVPVVFMIVVAILAAVFINMTRPGRHIILTGGNAEAAKISGILINRVKILGFMIMGCCVALASIVMNGRVASGQPTAGTGMEMDAIAAVVIGGTQIGGGYCNIFGSIFGALIVGIINNGLNLMHVSAYWQFAAKGLLILFAVLMDRMTNMIMVKQQIRATRNATMI